MGYCVYWKNGRRSYWGLFDYVIGKPHTTSVGVTRFVFVPYTSQASYCLVYKMRKEKHPAKIRYVELILLIDFIFEALYLLLTIKSYSRVFVLCACLGHSSPWRQTSKFVRTCIFITPCPKNDPKSCARELWPCSHMVTRFIWLRSWHKRLN